MSAAGDKLPEAFWEMVTFESGNVGNGCDDESAADAAVSVVVIVDDVVSLLSGSKMLVKSVSKPSSFIALPVTKLLEAVVVDVGFDVGDVEFGVLFVAFSRRRV